MFDVFDKIEAFLKSAEAKATEAVKKGAAALRELADYLEAQAGGTFGSAAGDQARAAELKARCDACCNTVGADAVGAPSGVVLKILIQLVRTALEEFLKK